MQRNEIMSIPQKLIPYRPSTEPQAGRNIIIVQQDTLPALLQQALIPSHALHDAAELAQSFGVSVRVYRKITITEE